MSNPYPPKSIDNVAESKKAAARLALKDVSNRSRAEQHKRLKAWNASKNKRNCSALSESKVYNHKKSCVVTDPVQKSGITVRKAPGTTSKKSTISYQDSGPAYDIDRRDSDNPCSVTAYVQDMFMHFRSQEHRAVVGDYMQNQDINPKMRAVLVDWLCGVHYTMKCEVETLYLTINVIDRFLSLEKATIENLQLIGSSALLLASKYEQIYPVETKDLVYFCDGLYAKEEIIEMEEKILKTLNYQISLPTIWHFYMRYLNASRADKKLVFLSSYILEESLLSYDLVIKYKPSQLAAAGILLARHAVGRHNWSPTMLKYSGYREEDVIPVARSITSAKNALFPGLDFLKKKYNRSKRFKASSITLPLI